MVQTLTRILVGTKMNTNKQKTNNDKSSGSPAAQPKGGCLATTGKVLGSSKPSTSKAVYKVQIGNVPVKTPASGATKPILKKQDCLVASHVPPLAQKGHMEIAPGPSGVPPPASSGSNSRPRYRTPSQRAFTARRSALRTIDRLGNKPVDELTEKEKSSLEWARAQLVELKRPLPPATTGQAQPSVTAAPKRQRSEEETQKSRSKRPKPARLNNRPYNEIVKDSLVRAVIDRSAEDGAISHEKWGIVQIKLMEVYWKVLEGDPGPPPQCDDAGWFQGHIKLIACADERSACLYKKAITSLGEVWQGSRLDVVSLNEIPRRPRSTARLPAVPCDPMEILKILQNSNPQLPTSDWKVVKVAESAGNSIRAIVVLNEQSLAPIRERRGKIYYGFGTINLRVYRGDDKGGVLPIGGKPGAPVEKDVMSCEEAAGSSAAEDTHSVSELVGEFFEQMDEAVDEDALLDSDPEDVDVTIIHNTDGEGHAN